MFIRLFVHSLQVREKGLANTVCTLFELLQGPTGAGSELHGLDQRVLLAAAAVLAAQGAAVVFGSETDEDGIGIKECLYGFAAAKTDGLKRIVKP